MINIDFIEKKPVPIRSVYATDKYPCIGRNFCSSLVVAFFKNGTGIVIKKNDFHPLNEVRNDWLTDSFEYLEAGATCSINITNE